MLYCHSPVNSVVLYFAGLVREYDAQCLQLVHHIPLRNKHCLSPANSASTVCVESTLNGQIVCEYIYNNTEKVRRDAATFRFDFEKRRKSILSTNLRPLV